MLDKCKRSCNLCGDLVQQKDRIQPTSKNYKTRRPTTFNPNQNGYSPDADNRLSYDANSNFNKFLGYFTDYIHDDATSTTTQISVKKPEFTSGRYYANWKSTTRTSKSTDFTTKGKPCGFI